VKLLGFSTGALAYSDFRKAIDMLKNTSVNAIELSALRRHELEPLVSAIPELNLTQFKYISVHAPGKYTADDEHNVVSLLDSFAKHDWPIVLHPDAIHDYKLWSHFGSLLLIENMDIRKAFGRYCYELDKIFELLPNARFCFDIAHIRQVDSSMEEAKVILNKYGSIISQVHISDVDNNCRHNSITKSAIMDYNKVSSLIPSDAAIIIETIMDSVDIFSELKSAELSLAGTPR
jgi:hypothetical protein